METVDLNTNRPFVDYKVNLHQKYLTFTYKNSNNHKISKIPITPTMYMLIKEIMIAKTVNKDLLRELSDTEKAIVYTCIKKMGIDMRHLNKYLGGDITDVLHNNIKILRGEYSSGNKSTIVRDALINNTKMLYISNLITRDQYNRSIRNIDKLHFE